MIQKKTAGSISIKSPNILFRAIFVIGYLSLQRLQVNGEFLCLYYLMFSIYISIVFRGEGVQNTSFDSVQSYCPCFKHSKLSNSRSEFELVAN